MAVAADRDGRDHEACTSWPRRRAGRGHLPPAVPRRCGAAGPDGGRAASCVAAGWPARSWTKPTAWRSTPRRRPDRAARADPRASLYDRGLRRARRMFIEEGIEHVAMEKRACLSCASTRCPGLRVIVAGERGRGPGAGSTSRRGRRSTPSATRSSRATRTGRRPRSMRCAPTAARPTAPGWRVRVVPNLYPALAPGEPDAEDGPAGAAAAASRTCSPPGPPPAPTR